MGYQPLPRKAIQSEAQPKDERPPLQGYGDNLQGSDGKESPFPVYYRSPIVPPSGPGGIARLPISPLTGEPYDPELIIRWPPHPSVDRRLIGTDY